MTIITIILGAIAIIMAVALYFSAKTDSPEYVLIAMLPCIILILFAMGVYQNEFCEETIECYVVREQPEGKAEKCPQQ